jgi:hypothetical protein
MTTPDDYWTSYEHEIDSLGAFLESVASINAYVTRHGTRFVWRGVSDASYGLQSSLARAYFDKNRTWPNETDLRSLEVAVLSEARAWPLDWHPTGGRLSALPLLAVLQHFGVPTRLIDFTFNPLVALCFAVEESRPGGDGRVFGVDVADRRVEDADAEQVDPWWLAGSASVTSPWCQRAVIWTPPPIEERIVRQQACFLLGGVPSTTHTRYVRDPLRRRLTASEVRECMSIPFTLVEYAHVAPLAHGRPPLYPAFTLRIKNQKAIKHDLERLYGYSMRSLFPDASGMATYGRSFK